MIEQPFARFATTPSAVSTWLGWHALLGAVLCSICLLAMAHTASATDLATPLGRIGLTPLQQQTGEAVNTVCPQLGELASRTPAQQDLFDRCGNMVGNAFELEGLTGGPRDKSLGLSQEALAAAVQTVANEELAATKATTTDIAGSQLNAGIARLHAVRSGTQFGLASLPGRDWNRLASLEPDHGTRALGAGAGDPLGKHWGFFLNGRYGSGDRAGTDRENAFDYNRWGLTAGTDVRLSPAVVLGGLLSFNQIDSDFEPNPAAPGGSIEADNWGLGLYGTFYRDAFYLDGLIGYNKTSYDLKRRILLPLGSDFDETNPTVQATDRIAIGATDSDNISLSLGTGLDLQHNLINYGPYARLTYLRINIDGYDEQGAFGLNLTVDEQNWSSFTSVIGARASAALSQSWGVMIPQLRLGWSHEFKNDARQFEAFYTVDPNRHLLLARTDDPDRNYLELGLSLSAVLPFGLQTFADYQRLLAHQFINEHVVTLGIRAEI